MPESKSTSIQLGKISMIDPHKVWLNEERDFTPWLAENIGELSRVIGVALKVEEIEKRVGAYELDIYAKDEDSGTVVIIENQLEATDHIHLGQLMTYAAGLEAKVIVWITPKIREEHRAAVEWFNRVTTEEVSFFLVRVEVLQIDNSRPAARFEVESAPNEFERTFGRARASTIAPTQMLWSDSTNNPIAVSKWRQVFRKVLERAAQENFSFQQLPIKSTTGRNEADDFIAPLPFQVNGQEVFVEGNYNAVGLQRRIENILRAMNKPAKFLRIECVDGSAFELPR